ncbi:hypothetical protein [Nostoc sp. DSM 114167]|jgi:thiamine kinase-like enzyme|uniref:hypothetical protein n=1 Tax=Nostoc sp. DSM 114167 TaxID=3439050 RepID=UPI0040465478
MHTDEVITNINQINLDWLNSALATDSIQNFAIEALNSSNSQLTKIQLQYQSETTGTLPASLLLKICADNNDIFGESEVNYYIRDYIELANRPIPTCYHARYAENPRRYHLLLEDLSTSHCDNRRIQPTLAYGCTVAKALATLHAHWWGVEKLRVIDSNITSQTEIEQYVAHVQLGLLPMLEEIKTKIDDSWKSLLIDVFENHPYKMIERTKNPSGFTLIHGDLNPGNVLSPLNGNGKTYLIDRQPFDWSLTTWLGVSDLAYMMVHWWETDLRRQWEIPILREYHANLISNGVFGYDWEQLVNDYKLTAVQSLYVATEWCVLAENRQRMKWLWFWQLQKSITAFLDLECSELWTGKVD